MWLMRYHFIVLLYAFFVHHTYKNLRIDEEGFYKLNKEELNFLCPLYKKKNLNLLVQLMEKKILMEINQLTKLEIELNIY